MPTILEMRRDCQTQKAPIMSTASQNEMNRYRALTWMTVVKPQWPSPLASLRIA